MSVNTLSEICRAITPAVGNHLWQSTMFAAAAGLLALAFRRNHARIRYALWLTASAKFLIPFSLLSALGSHLAWRRGSSNGNAAMYVAMDQLGEPFSQPTLRPISETVPAIHSSGLFDSLPVFLAAAWFCGVLFVVLVWYVRWRRISRVIRRAVPVREGRELELLRRFERAARMSGQIEIRVSPVSLEPGIFGVAWPILVWPQGISERLSDAHLESILAHELCHVRRRDNLSSAIHMAVEAIFWFHPIVWWMGTRLLEERERACDEQVLEMGTDRQAYAESILRICEFCVGSPLDFVSGVTGADLKKRIANIMSKNAAHNLSFGKKLLLIAVGLASVAVPLAFGLLRAPHVHAGSLTTTSGSAYFEMVSVQASPAKNDGTTVRVIPGRLTLANWTTRALIVYAYDVGPDHISGAPNWINSERYDIDANVDDSLAYGAGKLIEFNVAGRFPPGLRHDQLKLAVQSMLAERFKLRLSHETREIPVYALVVAKSGPKLHEAKPDDSYANGIIGRDGLPVGPHRGAGQNGHLTAQALPMSNVAMALSEQLNCTVLDKTGLTGDYDFHLEWKPEGNPVVTGGSIFSAIEQQLGLRLEPQKATTDFLLINHVEKPVQPMTQNSTTPAPSFASASIKANTTDTPMAGFNIKGKPFSAAMFKPDRFMATNLTLHDLVRLAYGVQNSQIAGGPDWISTEKYDVDARLDRSAVDELNKLSAEQGTSGRLRMIQSLLADHFKLAFHRETKELPAYTLVIGDGGPKLQAAKPRDTYPNGFKDPDGHPVGTGYFEPAKGKVVFQGRPLSSLVQYLSDRLGRAVVDKTGLTGNYDFALQWAPASPELSSPSILAAVQEQLGLRLDAQNTPTEVLVIDRAEKPSEK